MINWDNLDGGVEGYREQFNTSPGFRHVVMENFLDEDFCRVVGSGFEVALSHKDHGATKSHRDVLRKTGTPNLRVMTDEQVTVFEEIHSERFLAFLEKLTGIYPIYADKELKGGGLHSSARGGYLNVHTDFNFHPSNDTHRRLNLILYVNETWKEEWEGALELWNSDVSECVAKVFPKFNRAVLFETSEISFHGHPVPLACPDGVTRKSIAVYYYSKWPDGLERRAKTYYVLTPQQKGALRSDVELAMARGADNFEQAANMLPAWQPAHVKRMFAELANDRG